MVRKPTEAVSKPAFVAPTKDADTRALEGDLSASLDMQVQIKHDSTGQAGVLEVKYRNLDDLDMLCRVLSLASRSAP
jgi:ParB family chromosome partitioning protein